MSDARPEQTVLEFVQELAATQLCDDEPGECYSDSGPYCGRHLFDAWVVEKARKVLAGVAAGASRPINSEQEQHRCAGCGHRWEGELTGAELCGDCWRTAQPIVAASRPRPPAYCRVCDHTHLVGTACWFARPRPQEGQFTVFEADWDGELFPEVFQGQKFVRLEDYERLRAASPPPQEPDWLACVELLPRFSLNRLDDMLMADPEGNLVRLSDVLELVRAGLSRPPAEKEEL